MKRTKYGLRDLSNQELIERIFESILWNSRFIVLIGVLFGIFSAIVLFVVGSSEILYAVIHNDPMDNITHNQILIGIIGGIDFYLISVVLLLFSFGIYELFISKIDIGRINKELTLLLISSLDDLKGRIVKVIVMVLIVFFFSAYINNGIQYTKRDDVFRSIYTYNIHRHLFDA